MLIESQKLALAAVRNRADHHLTLGLRELIWSDLGDRATPGSYMNQAHLKRISLAVAGVKYVLPLWQQKYKNNNIPLVALSTINKLVAGDQIDASAIFDQLWAETIHLSVEQPFTEIAVGFSAVQALSTAMFDEFFDSTKLDVKRRDDDDPENHDSSYYASVAAAGGEPLSPQSSSERRLEFWNWWLTDGIKISFIDKD